MTKKRESDPVATRLSGAKIALAVGLVLFATALHIAVYGIPR